MHTRGARSRGARSRGAQLNIRPLLQPAPCMYCFVCLAPKHTLAVEGRVRDHVKPGSLLAISLVWFRGSGGLLGDTEAKGLVMQHADAEPDSKGSFGRLK